MKNIGVYLFIIPFILTALGIQLLVGKFISVSTSQIIAYGNVSMILLGILFFIRDHRRQSIPGLAILWFFFYAFYFAIGLWGNIIHNNEIPLLKSLIPVIYFVGFSFFLGIEKNRKIFENVLIIAFTLSNILLIYFDRINFSLLHDGFTQYTLERAEGVYADANNSAVVCLLSFIFIYQLVTPKNIFQRILKLAGLAIAVYGLFITFSKTGFLVLFIVAALLFHRLFNPKRILAAVILVPTIFYFLIQGALNSPNLSAVQKTRIQDVVNLITLNTSEVSYSGRDDLLLNMLSYINENPLLGNGINFSTYIRGHNTIIGIWADAGVFVFLLFLFILFSYTKNAILSSSEVRFFTLSILAVLVVFMFSLQSIINQGYLLPIFVYLAYVLDRRKSATVI